MMKSFAEIGFGNPTFINSKINDETGNKQRVPGLLRLWYRSAYLRIRVGTKVIIVDTKDGLKKLTKPHKKYKLVFGIYSEI